MFNLAVCPKAKGCQYNCLFIRHVTDVLLTYSVCYALLFIRMEASSNLQRDNVDVGETFEVKVNDHIAFTLEMNESK